MSLTSISRKDTRPLLGRKLEFFHQQGYTLSYITHLNLDKRGKGERTVSGVTQDSPRSETLSTTRHIVF